MVARTLQDVIGEWGDKTFPRDNTETALRGVIAHLIEEVDELAFATGYYGTEPEDDDKIRLEVADCAILLFQFAHLFGFDLREAVIEKHAINESRRWGTPDPETGVVRHVEGN